MEKEEIVKCVDNSIEELIRVFCETPYFFYTENDVHCFLYQLIYNNMNGKGEWHTKINGKKFQTLPVHKDYPTREFYKKYNGGNPKRSNDNKGTRRRFDIVVFNEGYIDFEFKNPKVSNRDPTEPFIAIQIGLDRDLDHLKYDWESLVEDKNYVEYKYLLHFDRIGKETIEDIKKKINPHIKSINCGDNKGGICCIDVSDRKILASKNLLVNCSDYDSVT